MTYHVGLCVRHKLWGQGIIINSDPLQIEFYREPLIKTFHCNMENQLEVERVTQVDRFHVEDRVIHKQFGKGIVCHKNNVTGEIVVMFSVIRENTIDAVRFETFKLDDESLEISK
jgi:hypothetical protein